MFYKSQILNKCSVVVELKLVLFFIIWIDWWDNLRSICYIMHNSQTNFFFLGYWTYWLSEFSTQSTVTPRSRQTESGESCWAGGGLLEILKSPEERSKGCLCLGLCFNFFCRSEEANCQSSEHFRCNSQQQQNAQQGIAFLLPFALLVPSPLQVSIVSVLGSNPPGGNRNFRGRFSWIYQLSMGVLLWGCYTEAVTGAISECLPTRAWADIKGAALNL